MVEPAVVRSAIARLWLTGERDRERLVTPRHGGVALRPHQRSALERLRFMLSEHCGALLADDVGLGKTYVATTLARDYERVLVVAPAPLRAMWIAALDATGARGTVTSYAVLSRGGGPTGPFDLVILDEAHHARTPGTLRYTRIATLTDRAHVLLLSATPIHNSRKDLAALLALFLGAHAWSLEDDALAGHVVRRERGDVPLEQIPDAAVPIELAVGDDQPLLRAIVALPPPLPPRGAGAGGALLTWGLVREWASSNAALEGALRRRLAHACALDAALAEGRLPSRGELSAWACGDQAVQLAFPALLDVPVTAEPERLRSMLERHERAVRALLERARASEWTDVRRAELLHEIRERHPGQKVVAFTQFADTARALFRLLARQRGVAVLTAHGARVAGGALSRREAIERFAPRASGVAPPREMERIDLLLATDLLSEGINLHDASVVVHIDLPWTPARMEQRVGRSRRLGALHASTVVYTLLPPASSELLLRVERRLRAKLDTARRTIGVASPILAPGGEAEASALERAGQERRDVVENHAGESATRRRELIARELESWSRETSDAGSEAAPRRGSMLVANTAASRSGVLALVRVGREYQLVAALGDAGLTDDPACILEVALLAGVGVAAASTAELRTSVTAVVARVERWVTLRAAQLTSGSTLPVQASTRRRALRQIAAIVRRAPRHRRGEVAQLAAIARRAATTSYGVGAEQLFDDLTRSKLGSGDEEWLRALGEFAAARENPASGGPGTLGTAPPVEPVAILIVHRE